MRPSQIVALAILVSGSVALTGCAGSLTSAGFPDTPAVVAPGALHGNNFGGHAPIAGAHLFVLEAEASPNGYGGKATSLLTSTDASVTMDQTGTLATNPTYGMYYITTDSGGAFNITGDYTCSVGRPVYLYAKGGSPGLPAQGVATSISQIDVGTTGASTAFDFTTATTQFFYVGEPVALSGFTGTKFVDTLNGQTATVQATNLSTTTFEVDLADTGTNKIAKGTYTTTDFGTSGVVTATPNTDNYQIVNLAMLGLCPGTSGEFANTLSYVYMNEVSTVAMAYAMAPFATNATNGTVQDATQIGSTSTNLLGLQNAAINAGQLYDIQGGNQSSVYEGEGHIARAVTPAGNGTVPQATLDTLGNVLAACVDSQNTYDPFLVTPTGTQSAQCAQLFSNATTTGGTTGSAEPQDTATAAFNIAHLPAGAASRTAAFMQNIYALQGSSYPFAPQLTAQPNDFSIAISFSGGGIGQTGGQSPHDVAIDASGNVYTTNFGSNKLVKFSPLGVPANSTGFGTALNAPGSVAVDSTSSYVWLVNYHDSDVSRFTTAGTNETEFDTGQTLLQDAEIDGSGNIWVTANNNNALVKLNSGGTLVVTETTPVSPFSLAIEPGAAGNIWVADETQNDTSVYTNAGAAYPGSPFTAGGIQDPTGNAIDAKGNVWFGNNNGTVTALTSTGAKIAGSPFATGNTNYSDGIAIDGLGDVWVTNSLGGAVYELSSAGAEISPTTGYTAKPATEADGLAIDGSGDVWYDSYNAAAIYELIGAAAPAKNPLSLAVQQSTLGTRP
jgi:streptogramin lyase